MRSFLKKILGFIARQPSSIVVVSSNAKLTKAASVKIINSSINLENDAQLILADGVEISNYHIHVVSGICEIDAGTRLMGNNSNGRIYIEKGSLKIEKQCVIKADFSIRFGGNCIVKTYTGIMDGTEIRCDEHLEIGAYNMISYDCMIYDTNTHCNYPEAERRRMTEKSFPNIGAETEKPKTAAVIIGNDCWLGKRSVILKGVLLGNNCTVAASAVVTKSCPANTLVYGNPAVHKTKADA